MATVKIIFFDSCMEAVFKKKINWDTDTFKMVLHNTAPDYDADTQYSDLAGELSTSGGYTAGGFTVTITLTMTDGLPSLEISGVSITASGSVGPFQYASVYDDTATNNDLVGTFDYGSADTLASGESFTIADHTIFAMTAM